MPATTTPEPAVDLQGSIYKVFTPDGSQGTAWVVAPHYLVTAGHVCDGEDGIFLLEQEDGLKLSAKRVVWSLSKDSDEEVPLDACLMYSEFTLGKPLPLAAEMPAIDTPVEYVGYPQGFLYHGHGVYAGDVDGPAQNWNDYFSTTPCDHGASGSAMYSEDGVYGILVRLYYDGEGIKPGVFGCVASPLSQIIELLSYIE